MNFWKEQIRLFLIWIGSQKFSEGALALDGSNEEAKSLSASADKILGSPTQITEPSVTEKAPDSSPPAPKPSSNQNERKEHFSEVENEEPPKFQQDPW